MVKKSSSRKETKKSSKEKFKKLISKFWFWIIVAVVSYFLMILMPFDWDKGLWEGSNIFGSIFAHLTKFAWIIAIAIIIIDGIKYIQKSKIGEYWKISLTIMGIIGIGVFVFFSVKDMAIFDNLTYEYDERIGDLNNQELIKININLLEEDGYEILYFGYLLDDTDLETAYLKMKSLGSRNNQVWDGLHSLGRVYPNAPNYEIVILEPMQECRYNILGNTYHGWIGSEDAIVDGEVIDSLTLHRLINYQIDEQGICS